MFLLKYVERQLSSCFSQKNRRSTAKPGGGQNNAECFLTECQNDKFSQYSIHSSSLGVV